MLGGSSVEYHPADLLSVALPKVAGPAERDGSVVIVDGPPVHAVETKIITGLTGWAIIVVDARRRDAFESLESTVLQLRQSGTEILGVVLNRQRRGASHRHGRYGLPEESVGAAQARARG
jgi:Mrp family chromosome partitioning ATPase